MYQLLVDEEDRIELPDPLYQQAQAPVRYYIYNVDPVEFSRDDSQPNHVHIYGTLGFNYDVKVEAQFYVDLRTGEITRELPPSATLD